MGAESARQREAQPRATWEGGKVGRWESEKVRPDEGGEDERVRDEEGRTVLQCFGGLERRGG